MKQLIIIHGGTVFHTDDDFYVYLEHKEYDPFEERKDRKDRLPTQVKDTYQVIKPTMPNNKNARYKARKMRFEQIIPYLNDDGVVLVGHSLGGIFLLKYLSENSFPKKIHQLHLVAAVLEEQGMPEEEKNLEDFVFDLDALHTIQDKVTNIFIYHSTNDPVVPYSQAKKIQSYLPQAKLITFTDRGHFNLPEFPELLENILHG